MRVLGKGRQMSPDSIAPLFIPLRSEHFIAFASGLKTEEYRIYGPRWNERTCPIGRSVVLSRGYGRVCRLNGIVVGFRRVDNPNELPGWKDCFGDTRGIQAAAIKISIPEIPLQWR